MIPKNTRVKTHFFLAAIANIWRLVKGLLNEKFPWVAPWSAFKIKVTQCPCKNVVCWPDLYDARRLLECGTFVKKKCGAYMMQQCAFPFFSKTRRREIWHSGKFCGFGSFFVHFLVIFGSFWKLNSKVLCCPGSTSSLLQALNPAKMQPKFSWNEVKIKLKCSQNSVKM